MGASKFMVSSIFYPRHLERSEGTDDRDFSPTTQNDAFLDTLLFFSETLTRYSLADAYQIFPKYSSRYGQ